MRSDTHSRGRKLARGRAAVGRIARGRGAGDGPDRWGGPPGRTTSTTPTTTPTAPGGTAQLQPDGTALPPANAPRQVRKAIKAGQQDPHQALHLGRRPSPLQVEGLRLLRRGQLRAARRRTAQEPAVLRSADDLGRPGHRVLDHGLREPQPRLDDGRRACGSTPPRSASPSTRARVRGGGRACAPAPATPSASSPASSRLTAAGRPLSSHPSARRGSPLPAAPRCQRLGRPRQGGAGLPGRRIPRSCG